jgi:hypothetical protein
MRIKFRLKFDRNEIRRKIDLELIFLYNLHRFPRTESGSLKNIECEPIYWTNSFAEFDTLIFIFS